MNSARRLQLTAERRPMAVLTFGVFMYSVGPVLVGSADGSGPVLSFWRLWTGVAVLAVAYAVHVAVTGRRPGRRGWAWAAGCGLAFALHQVLFMTAVQMTSVVDVTLMQVLQPVLVALLAVRMFDERPGARFRTWSAVSIVGATIVALGGSSGPEGDPLGIAFGALNVVFLALYFVGSKQARTDIDVVPFLFGTTLVAALVTSVLVVAVGEAPMAVSRHDLLLALAITLGPGTLGHFSVAWPLRWIAANVPPLMQLAVPFVAGFLAWVLLGQSIGPIHVIGGLITVAGAAGAILSPAGRRMIGPEDAVLAAGRD